MLTVFAARDTNVHLTHETVFADDDDKSGRTPRNTRVLPDIPDNVLTKKKFLLCEGLLMTCEIMLSYYHENATKEERKNKNLNTMVSPYSTFRTKVPFTTKPTPKRIREQKSC